MKRHGNLWQQVCDLENIRAAHHSARKGKAHYTEVKWVNANEEKVLRQIQDSLLNKTFTTSPYEVEDRFDGRKMRTIHKLPYYPDRIVQHALVNVCEPIWKASFDSNQGLPIGNYTSQYFGNIYLSAFDWWVKQEVKAIAYFRYCDDLVLIASSSAEAHRYRQEVFNQLEKKYNLTIKPDWQVFPVDDRGLDFVGFVFTSKKTRLRKSIAKGVKRKAKDIRRKQASMAPYEIANGAGSYWGWCKHGGGKSLWHNVMTSDIKAAIRRSKIAIKETQRCK